LAQSPKKQNSTKTSSYGTSGRRNHDSSEFYNSNLYKNYKEYDDENVVERMIEKDNLNKIYCKSSEDMSEIPDNSVHLMITSPPYNVKKEYDDDLTLDEYRSLLKTVFTETYKKLVTGGRACINIANVGRKPYIPLHSYIIQDMLEIGFEMRGEIIWNKDASAAPSTAWGSWMSASNPVLRDVHEYIMVFSKKSFSRQKEDRINTIEKNEFLEWTKSVWTFPTVSAKSIGHPAPFPEELPRRLIQLYSFESDIILDPFCGSGTTCLAAMKSGRNYIGYDIMPEYVELSNKRIKYYNEQVTLLDAIN
jgi:site-specific DNA-methyltransferase (adenine-specific)